MHARHLARVRALQALYEADLVGHPAGAALDMLLRSEDEGEPLPPEAAPAWPLRQMPPIDKNILRLAIFELLFDNRAVPVKVVINEAVELGKEFGGENTSRFVNGVLGTIASSRSKQP